MNNRENIKPEAGNLYFALRNSGYSNVDAIGDLIDNSLDAGAKNIKIDIADDLKRIFLSDDGIGMSPVTLNQALKLGGRKAHDDVSDLGKYGLGLIAASISMGTRLRIITRKDGITSIGIFDVNEVYSSNQFVASFREANEAEIRSFEYRTNKAKSGTVLIIEDCDKIQYNNKKDFVNGLIDYIKTAFWSFIADGKEIVVNDVVVPSEDPLFRYDGRTQTILNKTVDVDLPNGKAEKLEIFAVLIPDFGTKMNHNLHINIENQGFYVLRNNREIASAVEIVDVFKKHNDFNRLRIKLNFGPGLDEEMGVNYTKHNISPNRRMISILREELEDKVIEIRKKLKTEQKKRAEVRKKLKLENENPFAKVETTDSPIQGAQKPLDTAREKKNEVKTVDVKTRFKSENDKLLDISVSGDTASVWYNGANKFYRNNIVEKENGVEMKKCFDIILKAFVEASVKNNVSLNTISKISEDISSALEESEL